MGKKTSKQTQTQQTSSTSTPIVPTWASDTATGINSAIQALGGTDPYSYVPKTNAAQQQALDLAGTYNPGEAFTNLPTVKGESLLDNLDSYMNPYTDKVVNTTLAGFDENAGRTRALQAANLAKTKAFGGSRAGVREGITEELLSGQRSGLEAGLRSDAFNTGAGLSSQDAGRRQQASTTNAQNALAAAQSRASADANRIGLLAELGNQQYGRDQQYLQAPIDLLKAQTGLFAGVNPSSYFGESSSGTSTGTSKSSTSDPWGTIGSLAQAAAIFASDRRLKADVAPVGQDEAGRQWYDFRYAWEPRGTVHRGVMAQDLLKTEPWRVHRDADGFYAVDYAGLEPI